MLVQLLQLHKLWLCAELVIKLAVVCSVYSVYVACCVCLSDSCIRPSFGKPGSTATNAAAGVPQVLRRAIGLAQHLHWYVWALVGLQITAGTVSRGLCEA
jgi:hypothetical protein